MDVSFLPGTGLGFNTKLNTKVKINVKVIAQGKVFNRSLYVSKEIYTKNEKAILDLIGHTGDAMKGVSFLQSLYSYATTTSDFDTPSSGDESNSTQTPVIQKRNSDTTIIQLYGYKDSVQNVHLIYDSSTTTTTSKFNSQYVPNIIIVNP